MSQEFDVVYWNKIKIILKNEYSQLTDADFVWRNTSPEDILRTIANKLGITLKDIREVIKTV
jgi:hypothetical protein